MADRPQYRPPYTNQIEDTPYSIPSIAPGVGRAVGGAAKGLYESIERMVKGGQTPADIDPADVMNVIGLMGGAGIPRALAAKGGAELAASGAAIMKRADTRKMIKELWTEGKTEKQIAEAINERFAPLLDEGSEVTKGMVSGVRGRAQKAGEYEVGSMGSSGQSPPGRVTSGHITEIAKELGLASRVKGSSSGTEYVKVSDPVVAPSKELEVRIPSEFDPHAGRPRPFMIDTNSMSRHPTPSQYDLAGDAFDANLPAVRSRIEYSFGKQKPPTEAPAVTEAGPGVDPRQLKLLSGGVPVPSPSIWDQFPRVNEQ